MRFTFGRAGAVCLGSWAISAIMGFSSIGCLAPDSDSEAEEAELAEASAEVKTGPAWTFTLQGTPGLPQDVWIEGHGSNTSGWNSGGSVCLGLLANDQGPTDPQPIFLPGDHVMLVTDVVEGGIYGVDGTPVPPGDYVAPGIDADARPARDFTLAPGNTFYAAFDGEVVNTSQPPVFPAPVGTVTRFMMTVDWEGEGRHIVNAALWIGVPVGPGYFYFPFINEGELSLVARLN